MVKPPKEPKRKARRAQLVAEAVAVICPHCGDTQPNPRDGSELWLPENFGEPSKVDCRSCDQPMFVFSDSKVQFH